MTMYRLGQTPESMTEDDAVTWQKIVEVLPAATDTLIHAAWGCGSGVEADQDLSLYSLAERHINCLIKEGCLVEVQGKVQDVTAAREIGFVPGPIQMEDFAELIPSEFRGQSGSAFYSGRLAFQSPSRLYILGVNPSGSPEEQAGQTVGWHTNKVLYNEPDNWSAYRDELWDGKEPGSWRMQQRVLRLLQNLGLNPGKVPASNLVFLRSLNENQLDANFEELAEQCWPFHQSVINRLGMQVVLCFGNTAGDWIRERLDAHDQVSFLDGPSQRGMTGRVYESPAGLKVVVATHPSQADWRAPATDPTELVRRALAESEIERSETFGFTR